LFLSSKFEWQHCHVLWNHRNLRAGMALFRAIEARVGRFSLREEEAGNEDRKAMN
jgi:hypothetical protein